MVCVPFRSVVSGARPGRNPKFETISRVKTNFRKWLCRRNFGGKMCAGHDEKIDTGSGSVESCFPPMGRVITFILTAIIVFGGWMLLKAKVFTPPPRQETSAAPAAPHAQILWTADDSEIQGSGDDPHTVFASGLNRYLGRQV